MTCVGLRIRSGPYLKDSEIEFWPLDCTCESWRLAADCESRAWQSSESDGTYAVIACRFGWQVQNIFEKQGLKTLSLALLQ